MQGPRLYHKPHLPKKALSSIQKGHCAMLPLEDGAICEDTHTISSYSLEGANLFQGYLSPKEPNL